MVRNAVPISHRNVAYCLDEVKNRLNSLEAGQTTLKLVTRIYSAGSWRKVPNEGPQGVEEEWELRSTISSWGWRFVSELRNVKDEGMGLVGEAFQASTYMFSVVQIFSVDVLPLLTPPLSAFIPPLQSIGDSTFSGSSTLATLVESDFDVLEYACTLIESLTLDVEDIRLALARGFFSSTEHLGVPCFSTILDFVEQGDYPLTWSNPQVFDDTERIRKEKDFGICKAALVKVIVEVAGEEKNAEILWDESDTRNPGGAFVNKMVSWIKSYVESSSLSDTPGHGLRDDLVIAASLSLGNLSRRRTS
jgi:hypothetical protein